MFETIYNKTYKPIFSHLYIISYYITHFCLLQMQNNTKRNIKILIGGEQNRFILLFLTLVVGSIFGLAVAKIKIPGGLLVGAIVGVAALNILFGTTYMPTQTKLFVQIIAGAFIGCIMEKSDVKRLPKIQNRPLSCYQVYWY